MKIVGSVIVGKKIRPFILDDDTNEIILDEYSWERHIPQNARGENYVIQKIQRTLSIPVENILLGRYFCENCKCWFNATDQEWSFGICLYCSLDRNYE